MKCNHCGKIIPEDSEFCHFCGGKIENVPMQDPSEKTKNPNGKRSVISIIGLVLSLVLVVLNIYQYSMNKSNSSQLDALKTQIQKEKEENDTLSKNINDKQDKISELEKQVNEDLLSVNNYKSVLEALDCENLGYVSRDFRTSESVIILDKNEKNRKITLTASWNNGGTVTTSHRSFQSYVSAVASIDSSEWTTSTKVTIEPRYPGVTRVSFSSTEESKVLHIVVIVTE